MTARVLVCTGARDPVLSHLAPRLRARGAELVSFDYGNLPIHASATLALGARGEGADGASASRARLRVRGNDVDLGSIDAVWLRGPLSPAAHKRVRDRRQRKLVTFECRDLLFDMWRSMSCRFLPARHDAVQRAELKASQLDVAARVGLRVPDTIVTNDPDAVIAFHRRHAGAVVTKLASAGAFPESDLCDDYGRFTERLSSRDIVAVEAVRLCPITVQEALEKAADVRVTVVGDRVFAAEIDSQRCRRSAVDSRRHDPARVSVEATTLPPDVVRGCHELLRRLDLSYGAFDFVRHVDGGYVFLEVNPTGEYLWIEASTGYPMTDAICDWLCGVGDG